MKTLTKILFTLFIVGSLLVKKYVIEQKEEPVEKLVVDYDAYKNGKIYILAEKNKRIYR